MAASAICLLTCYDSFLYGNQCNSLCLVEVVSSVTFPFIRICFCNRFRKKPCPYCRSVTPFRKRRCRSRHICAWPGGPTRLADEFPAHPSGRSSRPPDTATENRTRFCMNGRTATTNLRKRRTLLFYVISGILTEFLRINVILTYFLNRVRRYGYGRTET